MEFRIIWVGRSQKRWIEDGIEEFSKRLKHYCKLNIIEIPDVKNAKNLSVEELKKKEGEQILKKAEGRLILLDEKGKSFTSTAFSKQIEKFQNSGVKVISLVIGGAFGFSEEVYTQSQEMLRLSDMTFSHQMIRVFLLEQIYRGYSIIKGEPYHNE